MQKPSLMLLLVCLTTVGSAQLLNEHRWERRILLVFTNQLSNENVREQVVHWQADEAGLTERNLVIYTIGEETGKFGGERILSENEVTALRKKYQPNGNFEVLLIGKDGGVKLRQQTLLTREKLFAIIDGMPMRRAEMRNGDN